MHAERFQNDRHFVWYFYLNNESKTPFTLEGRDLTLEVQAGLTRVPIPEFTVSGNSIDFYFRGKDQKRPAPIVLTLYIDKGKPGMMSIDAIAGEMTPHSGMPGCKGHTGVSISGVELVSFVGEWIDERLIPATIARVNDVNESLAALRNELNTFKSAFETMLDRLQEAAHWSDGFIWKDSLIWRE